jgi:hypothetical protein
VLILIVSKTLAGRTVAKTARTLTELLAVTEFLCYLLIQQRDGRSILTVLSHGLVLLKITQKEKLLQPGYCYKAHV